MPRTLALACIVATLLLVAHAASPSAPGPAGDTNSMVITFKDGHRQTVSLEKTQRVEFKSGTLVYLSDGKSQTIPLEDIDRIEFKSAAADVASLGKNHFLGKWQVGDGQGNTFDIMLESDGVARKSIGSRRGTWTVVNGEARIAWDDGWHDVIRKVGTEHQKFAFAPGKSYSEPPSNVAGAKRDPSQPI